jgi:tetratricopeptide (TPR) repeat protein
MEENRLDLAKASLQRGEFGVAKDLLLAFMAEAPRHVDGAALLGATLLFLNDAAAAVQYLKIAAEATPGNSITQYYLGHASMLTGDLETAARAFRCVSNESPMAVDAHAALSNIEQKQLSRECDSFEESVGDFVTFHPRPVRAQHINLQPDGRAIADKIAIVIQGPLLHAKDFTLETVLLYRKLFPYAGIVVSTWDDEPASAISLLEANGAMVITSAKPSKTGVSNINMQICSARAGMAWAAEHGYDYALKTRTDFRIHNPSFFVSALTLMDAYPLAESAYQRKRLVAFSDVVKYMPYAVPDKNMFGAIEDMVAYWSPPLDERTGASPGSLMEMARFGVAECYLTTRYLERLGRPLAWTYEDSWAALRDHFVFIDQAAADVYWHKYQRQRENRWKRYDHSTTFEEFGFSEWLRIYVGRFPLVGDPRIGDLGGGVPIDAILEEYNSGKR